MSERRYGLETRAIHTHPPEQGIKSEPIAVPIFQTASFAFDDAQQLGDALHRPDDSFSYSRLGNPTVAALENGIADLEDAGAGLAFASGMAAIYTTLVHHLKAGDHVVAPAALYGGTFYVLRKMLPRFGIEASFVDYRDLQNVRDAIRPETKIVYAETIANPILAVPDLAALAEIAHGVGSKLIVDSTFATPALCRPMNLGADLVMHSASKYLGGHGDLIAGLVVGSKETISGLRHTAIETGGAIAPFVAWLILRGLKTLALRVERHSASALRIAGWLATHPQVLRVDYPGLPTDPHHRVAAKELGGRFGGVLAFHLDGREAGARFCDRLQLIKRAGSLGDTHSLVIQPSTTTHRQLNEEELAAAQISPGFIRMSVGLEDPEDLLADLEQALT